MMAIIVLRPQTIFSNNILGLGNNYYKMYIIDVPTTMMAVNFIFSRPSGKFVGYGRTTL